VVGSYAVYHKTKANHRIGDTNYATGKAFHIYRPKAIDANGAEVWAQLHYSEGLLSVAVPQEFLEKATYPVVVDPTFGYTTPGGTMQSNLGNRAIAGTKEALTESGDVTKISVYGADTSGTLNAKALIYDDDGTGADPGTLMGVTEAISVDTTTQFRDYSFASPISLTAANWWLAFTNDADTHTFYWDANASYKYIIDTSFNYATPGTLDNIAQATSRRVSIYATYTADAGGATIDDTYFEVFD
jgi:hypothetical protein